MRQIIAIWKKELTDSIRDRRTLASMIIMPLVLMPLLIVGIGEFTKYQIKKFQEQTVKISFENAEYAPGLMEVIKKANRIEVVDADEDLKKAIENGKIDAGIVVPRDFNDSVKDRKPVKITILGKSTEEKARTAFSRINLAVAEFNDELIKNRMFRQDISPSILSGVSAVLEDVASEKERAGFGLAFLIPLFIVLWSITGGQYTAIDASAGEKERRTLEPLLLTPVKRFNIVAGKFLAVATAAIASAGLGLTSFFVTFNFFVSPSLPGNQLNSLPNTAVNAQMTFDFTSIGIGAVVLLFLISILLALMFSAILLSIAIFAKSFKEAQSYISPSYLVVILPIILVNMSPNLKPTFWFFGLPAINAVLLFREILMGVFNFGHIFLTMASLSAYSLIALVVATKIYGKESVLFRD